MVVMKNILLLFLFLIPLFLFAQYPTQGNKSRLGHQTTGDGLIWRGVAADTSYKPIGLNYPYFQLDTVNGIFRRYIKTRGRWQEIGGGTDIDSLIYATRFWVNSNFFPLQGGTLTGTGGSGFIGFPSQVSAPGTPASGLNVYAQGSSFNWKGTDGFERQFASTLTGGRTYTLPDVSGTFALGTGTTDRLARWTGTNTLAAGNLTDNGTKLQALLPWQFQTYTTAGLPTGVTGYHVYNTTTNGPAWYQGSRWAYGLESTFNRGTAANIPYFDANGQITQNSGFLFTGTFHRVRINSSNFVGFQVINDGTGINSTAGLEVVNGAGAFMDVGISSSTGTGFIGASSGFYAAPPSGIAFNTQTIGSNFRFGFNGTERVRITNAGLFVGQTNGTESVDIADDLRVRDSIRINIASSILQTDASGWVKPLTFSGGLSYSGGVLNSKWLSTELPNGDVQINAANNSLRLNNLDTAKFNNAIITSVGTNLLLMNPNVGATGIDDFGGGFHTNINGTIESNPGYANIVIGGVIKSGGDQFRMSIGYLSDVTGIGSIGLGYDADANGIAAMAIGLAARADENYEISLGSNEYKKLNLWAGQSGGSIVAVNYGTGTKEAADLSKTESVYDAVFATDGTVLERHSKVERYYTITSTSSPQTLSNNFSDNLINQGGTQATFTLKFPASPVDGQVLKITYNNAITTLTLDGNGNTIVGSAVTTGVAGSQRAFKFYTGIGWIKLY